MRTRHQMRSRWLLSTVLGAGLAIASGGAALAQAVPGNTAAVSNGPAESAATLPPSQPGMMVPPSPELVHQQVGEIKAATSGAVNGNPDNSADQLNARVLSVTGQPS